MSESLPAYSSTARYTSSASGSSLAAITPRRASCRPGTSRRASRNASISHPDQILLPATAVLSPPNAGGVGTPDPVAHGPSMFATPSGLTCQVRRILPLLLANSSQEGWCPTPLRKAGRPAPPAQPQLLR